MMSDEEFDEESYIAYENELYGEKSSDSEEGIDSEIEEALYSQLHYSFSLPIEEELDKQNNDHNDEDDNSDDSCDDDDVDSDSSDDNQELHIVNQVDPKDHVQDDLDKDEDSTEKIDYIVIDEESCSNSGISNGDNNEESKNDDNDNIDYTRSKATAQEDWSLIEEDLQSNLLADGKRRSVSRYYKKSANFRCRNCNEKGHKAVDCPTPKKISCFLCGGEHMRKWCPNELCFNCHEPGHRVMNCRKPRTRPDDQCRRCFMLGHFSKDCPDRWRQYHRTTEAKKQPVANRTGESTGPIYCYNCSDQGHYGHECLEDRMDIHLSPAYPFVVKYDGDPQSHQHKCIWEDKQRKRTQTHDGTISHHRKIMGERPSKRQRQNERQSWPKQCHDVNESQRKTSTEAGIDDGEGSYVTDGRVGQFTERISERTKKQKRGTKNRKSWTAGQSCDHVQNSITQQDADEEIIIIDSPKKHNPKGSTPGSSRKDKEVRIGSKRRHSETLYHDESKKGKPAENRLNKQRKKKNKGKCFQSASHDERIIEIVHDDEIQAHDNEYQSKQGREKKNKKFTKPKGQIRHHHSSPALDRRQLHSSADYVFGCRQSGSSHPHNKKFNNQRLSWEYNGKLFITSRGFQSKRK